MTKVPPPQIEFDRTNPLMVVIEPNHRGEFEIQVSGSAIFRPDEKYQSQKMFERIERIVPPIAEQWTKRRVEGAPPGPHFIMEKGHRPIVVRPAETVKFTSQKPFMIWAQRDPDVTPNLESPENPFGWSITQVAGRVEGLYEVTAQVSANISPQRFYKCVGWIETDPGSTVLVDPDVIGL